MIDILLTLGQVFSLFVILYGAYLALVEVIETARESGEDQEGSERSGGAHLDATGRR